MPLLNQTPQLTPAMFRKAFGAKVKAMEQTRSQYDPNGRLLNDYYRSMFSAA